MKRLFKLIAGHRKPVNKLEAHLIETAKTWCEGRNVITLETLQHFKNALERERELYCADNKSSRASSVSIQLSQDESRIWISPANTGQSQTATIELLTAEEQDHLEVQDSLLIPIRS